LEIGAVDGLDGRVSEIRVNSLLNRIRSWSKLKRYQLTCGRRLAGERFSSAPPTVNDINHLLNPITGAGITIQLLGYGASVSCLLKLYNLPFIELYVPRNPGDASYKEAKVKRSNKDEVLAQCLAKELIETKGDSL
jgi:hypothetical protein